MKSTQENLLQFLEKAYELTVQSLKLAQNKNFEKLNEVLDNRERAINIVHSMSENISVEQKTQQPEQFQKFNNQVSRVIDQINSIDEIVMSCLESEKEKTQFEIAKTFKNKEDFRGYNLSKIK